jgi:NitT/TauT family transport system ATP-binding protein
VTDTLEFAGVSLRYAGGTHALDDVSLSLRAGEFVAVVGPSGCGKSTLLRLASGLMTPDSGDVRRGTDRIGFVFQDPTLLPWRSVRRNVELVGELRGLSRDERRARAADALRRVGLADFADHRPSMLSGGMRMRVSLARTLTVRPDLFLFDEPFGAVDEITRAKLGDDLLSLYVADRFSALFVTHSVAEAVYLSNRVLVMSDRPGRFLGEVTVPLPYPRPPESRYTAEFAALTAQVFALLGSGDADARPAVARRSAGDSPVPRDTSARDAHGDAPARDIHGDAPARGGAKKSRGPRGGATRARTAPVNS